MCICASSVSCMNGITNNVSKCIDNEIIFDGLKPSYKGRILSEHTGVISNAVKLLVFLDSTECHNCRLSRLDVYDDFIELESNNERFNLIFVMSPSMGYRSSLLHDLYLSRLSDVIYLDMDYQFMKHNPFIPRSTKYHSFLLDSTNRIKLVGDPGQNERLKQLYMEQIFKIL